MPGSRASVFGESEDFENALRADCVAALLVTGRGQFRARLTQISLDRLRLASAEEEVARVALVAVPADTVLVSWLVGGKPGPVWGGIEMRAGEVLTLGPGSRVHVRTGGPCRWDTIRLPEKELLCYGRAMCGPGLVVPPASGLAAHIREILGTWPNSSVPPSAWPKLGWERSPMPKPRTGWSSN